MIYVPKTSLIIRYIIGKEIRLKYNHKITQIYHFYPLLRLTDPLFGTLFMNQPLNTVLSLHLYITTYYSFKIPSVNVPLS